MATAAAEAVAADATGDGELDTPTGENTAAAADSCRAVQLWRTLAAGALRSDRRARATPSALPASDYLAMCQLAQRALRVALAHERQKNSKLSKALLCATAKARGVKQAEGKAAAAEATLRAAEEKLCGACATAAKAQQQAATHKQHAAVLEQRNGELQAQVDHLKRHNLALDRRVSALNQQRCPASPSTRAQLDCSGTPASPPAPQRAASPHAQPGATLRGETLSFSPQREPNSEEPRSESPRQQLPSSPAAAATAAPRAPPQLRGLPPPAGNHTRFADATQPRASGPKAVPRAAAVAGRGAEPRQQALQTGGDASTRSGSGDAADGYVKVRGRRSSRRRSRSPIQPPRRVVLAGGSSAHAEKVGEKLARATAALARARDAGRSDAALAPLRAARRQAWIAARKAWRQEARAQQRLAAQRGGSGHRSAARKGGGGGGGDGMRSTGAGRPGSDGGTGARGGVGGGSGGAQRGSTGDGGGMVKGTRQGRNRGRGRAASDGVPPGATQHVEARQVTAQHAVAPTAAAAPQAAVQLAAAQETEAQQATTHCEAATQQVAAQETRAQHAAAQQAAPTGAQQASAQQAAAAQQTSAQQAAAQQASAQQAQEHAPQQVQQYAQLQVQQLLAALQAAPPSLTLELAKLLARTGPQQPQHMQPPPQYGWWGQPQVQYVPAATNSYQQPGHAWQHAVWPTAPPFVSPLG